MYVYMYNVYFREKVFLLFCFGKTVLVNSHN